ncbi:hypothetical protein GOODEAATRI_026053 [Goodea atripinnis]|uniref:Uncharacterized protein n=1 Tax=Goodea atripinnis TaxID=208336 RepID=A0ABV0P7V6_9TELE
MVLYRPTMESAEEESLHDQSSEEEASELSDGEGGLKQCLADFRKDLPWVERLDMTNLPAQGVLSKPEEKVPAGINSELDADDDFQREMFL